MQTDKTGGWNVGSGLIDGLPHRLGKGGDRGRSRNIHTSASGPRFLTEKDDGPDLWGVGRDYEFL